MKKEFKLEGFWYSVYEPHFPHPVASVDFDNWINKEKFIAALNAVENKLAVKTSYRGFSLCRICESRNGSTEFELQGWRWPVGLKHYIVEHQVKPSTEFEEFILSQNIH